ncbi:MAG: methyltransferase domain-containing protein [Balneolaceae bacterium]
MNWFEEWFDSPLYEKLYINRNESEAEDLARLIEKIIPRETYPKVLDLGCGRGRHSLTLAEKGYGVMGIDLSPQAIAKATKKVEKRGLENVQFKEQDMRIPLDDTFDAVVNLFTTFGYFLEDSENIKVLRSVHSMLRTKGRFMIDFLNTNLVEKNLVRRESGRYENLYFDIERFIEDEMVYKKITFSGDDLEEAVHYQERVKLYDLNWFKQKFDECGFSLKNGWGNYSGEEFNPEKSPRLILLAEK